MAESGVDQLTVDEIGSSLQIFSILDYFLFTLMLVASGCIGIYFGFIKKFYGEDEYLVGGRNMQTFPVSLSLIASFVSGITLLGLPTEIYVHGTSYLFIVFAIIFVGLAMTYIYLPVLHTLNFTSSYEYLGKRFDRKIHCLGSGLFFLAMMSWLPIVIYVPALAFNQVTGVNVHIITPVVCAVCIFYTCMGGLRAVVWTDCVQILIMFGSMLLIVIKGTIDLGGFDVVIQRNQESGRLELPATDLSFITRHTYWGLFFGGFFFSLSISSINQSMLQRYIALPNLRAANRALWIFIFGMIAVVGICGYTGMLIYAKYHSCDPLTTKLINAKDQLLPLLVMDILGKLPGFPGLFVAGVFSAALSSLSTGLNALAAVIFEDFIKPFRKTPLCTKKGDIIIKLIIVVLGILCLGLVFIFEKAGTHVLQFSIAMDSVAAGPSLALFTMGVLLPWVNAKGALIGGLTGLGFMSWFVFSSQTAIATGNIKFDQKPISTEGCTYSFPFVENLYAPKPSDSTFENIEDAKLGESWSIYHISYLWYTVLGTLITMSVSLIVSIIFPERVQKLDPMLVAPPMRRFLKNTRSNFIKLSQVEASARDTQVSTQSPNETSDTKLSA